MHQISQLNPSSEYTKVASGAAVQAASPEQARLKKAVHEFEALFMTQVLQEMRKTIPEGGLLAGGSAGPQRMYESMSDEQLGYSLSQGRGTGLSQALLRQLLHSSGQKPAPASLAEA
ncbi:hypothetical protein COW36_12490 [bacterium (Candidatus Blackallbacteria) CG17_big_fil_post_rev_8_21_14_2_50_48_46]|uniref:Flagellar protein FlgJ N-terminal domain-containing protein n=1 Tax=bacterium (Candidatus Blackallbacteria) CG17_big_fil_post_rev_8_21_14_2_50_48_46 TaxID=2014261 RepID=A0A2M7G3Z8_9BACT|nr:MAG: hypothetical protein COW64_02770 [bacterium (Candidatus Blackallbacteria) CG18_big_fil_WC_8_21_14_2_50_49_26]PIW16579.1 MAG: hypothetical protein COW36_12490 [bacterium (Candidatus Blackallbacteria) CG17_big_fil_post_rev_8_21_14_2_50_48_46]PIW46087.1 MAG: hypothetical protein COW20_17755 [bacterium (Candidatus Blackallbacteria) CG13_big_fil_rev_8_21_14_2_50_49_14]